METDGQPRQECQDVGLQAKNSGSLESRGSALLDLALCLVVNRSLMIGNLIRFPEAHRCPTTKVWWCALIQIEQVPLRAFSSLPCASRRIRLPSLRAIPFLSGHHGRYRREDPGHYPQVVHPCYHRCQHDRGACHVEGLPPVRFRLLRWYLLRVSV